MKPDANGPTCGRLPTDQAPTLQMQGIAPEHTQFAGASSLPTNGSMPSKSGLVREPGKAREITRQEMAFFLSLSNYRNIWKGLGFYTGLFRRPIWLRAANSPASELDPDTVTQSKPNSSAQRNWSKVVSIDRTAASPE